MRYLRILVAIAGCMTLTSAISAEAPGSQRSFAERAEVGLFIAEMRDKHGFDADILHVLFRRIRPIPAVIKAIMPPKDPGVRSWHAYRSRFVEPVRIAAGRRFMRQHAAEIAAAEARFGVPAEIIAAIIGVETIYGRQLGRFGIFAALSTLAFDYPPRAELFRRELEELLLLAREEDRSPLSYVGSYAGALGLPQFLPSSRRLYAIDFDGDGRVDLAGSPADAIGSVASFLASHGWQKGAPIAVTVNVAGPGAESLIAEGIVPQRTPRQMEAANVAFTRVGDGDTALNAADEPLPQEAAALIDLATPNATTEYRLGYRNFYVLTRYNRSSFYAAAVIDLAETLRRSE